MKKTIKTKKSLTTNSNKDASKGINKETKAPFKKDVNKTSLDKGLKAKVITSNSQSNVSGKQNAKFAFFYLLSLAALVFFTVSSGMIIFEIINKHIIDIFESNTFSSEPLKFALSALLVAVPVYYWSARQIYKDLASGKIAKDSEVRKWFTYLIILISSLVTLGWFIGLINSFFNGELTLKFILKFLTIVIIAGLAFSFYLYDIKREKTLGDDKVVKIYFWSSLALAIIIFVSGLLIVESPREARNRRVDEMVINNFYSLEGNIEAYYNNNGKLPENLKVIKGEYNLPEEVFVNPQTKEEFIYSIVNQKEYKLCNNFLSDNRTNKTYYPDNKLHDSGYQCLNSRVNVYNKNDLKD